MGVIQRNDTNKYRIEGLQVGEGMGRGEEDIFIANFHGYLKLIYAFIKLKSQELVSSFLCGISTRYCFIYNGFVLLPMTAFVEYPAGEILLSVLLFLFALCILFSYSFFFP